MEAVPNKGLLGKTFRKDAKMIYDSLAALGDNELDELGKRLETNG